jgi:hypothetical protein
MEEIRIPNSATYAPFSLTDIAVAAPLVSRVLLGFTLPGRMLQAVALGAYVGSAVTDWVERLGVRRMDFMTEFGGDVKHLLAMPRAERERDAELLATKLNATYDPGRIPRAELAVLVDRHITDYIASITGQRVETSTEVRDFSLAKLVFPFALGAYDLLSGDIAILYDAGILEPHVVAHEFCHRKGYFKELEAQVLAYLALTSSDEPLLVQSALTERLHRTLRVLSDDDHDRYREQLGRLNLRPELHEAMDSLRPELGPVARPVADFMRTLYDERMKLTGQNGLSDYDRGFTDLLYTLETSTKARQRMPEAGALR